MAITKVRFRHRVKCRKLPKDLCNHVKAKVAHAAMHNSDGQERRRNILYYDTQSMTREARFLKKIMLKQANLIKA